MQKSKLLTKEEYSLKVEKELARLNNNREAWHQIAALLQPPKPRHRLANPFIHDDKKQAGMDRGST